MCSWPRRIILPHYTHVEEKLLLEHARFVGVPVIRASASQLERKRVEITLDDLVAGDVPMIIQAMHQLGIDAPRENSYPACLHGFLGRTVTPVSSLGKALMQIDHSGRPLFIKPHNKWKRFTGFVQYPGTEDYRLTGVSRRMAVWTSEIVSIESEWRAYVIHGKIEYHALYHGEDEKLLRQPNMRRVKAMVDTYTQSGEAPDGYALDFYINAKGETHLLEVNGGFSVGAYGSIPAITYWDMTAAYWLWLMKGHKEVL